MPKPIRTITVVRCVETTDDFFANQLSQEAFDANDSAAPPPERTDLLVASRYAATFDAARQRAPRREQVLRVFISGIQN